MLGLFITLEGGEGCGKSVQARALYERLVRLAIPVVITHEPGDTSLGNRVSHWLKWPEGSDILPLTELLLFNASRAQLVTEIIKPNLEKGTVVICDRFADSTTAYQGYGRGLDLETAKMVNNAATQGLKPDLTILLDVSAEAGLARKSVQRRDRFEEENLTFHEKVRQGYLKMAANDPQRWLVIDALQSKEKIEQIIWRRVSQLLLHQGD